MVTDVDSWIISKSFIIHQKYGYNYCGPIACLVLGSFIEPETVNISSVSPQYHCYFVVNIFKEMVKLLILHSSYQVSLNDSYSYFMEWMVFYSCYYFHSDMVFYLFSWKYLKSRLQLKSTYLLRINDYC